MFRFRRKVAAEVVLDSVVDCSASMDSVAFVDVSVEASVVGS